MYNGIVLAGAARADISPPPGLDLMGYLRRFEPSAGVSEPLEATTVVVEDASGNRVVIVGMDVLGTPGVYGRRIREAIALAVGCPVEAVLVNSSHTHAAPMIPSMPKTGGEHEPRAEELEHAERIIPVIAEMCREARDRMTPVRIGAGRSRSDLNVNRRQRTPEGATILGWNPDGPVDRDVDVVSFDAIETGESVATIVVFACHPVVVGPEVSNASADFVGPLRTRVREWTAGECVFLQGCAGNVMPHEALFDHAGPEHDFGRILALAALEARTAAAQPTFDFQQVPYASAVPFGLWRKVRRSNDLPVSVRVVERPVAIPLKELPTQAEAESIAGSLHARLAELRSAGEDRSVWNPVALHCAWADEIARRSQNGELRPAVDSTVQVVQIGEIEIVGLPCEAFSELGLGVKARSGAGFTSVLGYTNDCVGYVASAEEHPYGGYEPCISHRHYGQPVPFAPEAARYLVDQVIEISEQIRAVL